MSNNLARLRLGSTGHAPLPTEPGATKLSVPRARVRAVSWTRRRYHAVTCTDHWCDPSCAIGDPARSDGRLCPRVGDEIHTERPTLAP